jgi:two-component system, OmpR family, response regulator
MRPPIYVSPTDDETPFTASGPCRSSLSLKRPGRRILPQNRKREFHNTKERPMEPMLKVLVVEDNVDAAQSLAALLQAEGYEVEVAYDGPAGIHLGRWWRPDVVLLDIGLPGVDGWQIAELLKTGFEKRDKQTGKNPLVVAVTGFGTEADRRRSAEAGIHLHLVKPVDPERRLCLLRRFKSLVA